MDKVGFGLDIINPVKVALVNSYPFNYIPPSIFSSFSLSVLNLAAYGTCFDCISYVSYPARFELL